MMAKELGKLPDEVIMHPVYLKGISWEILATFHCLFPRAKSIAGPSLH